MQHFYSNNYQHHNLKKILAFASISFCVLLQNKTAIAQTDSGMIGTLDEVIVTGQYHAQSLKKSVYQVKIIDHKKILAKGAASVQQLLSTELGIRFSNDQALGISDVSLMGMSGRSVKILLDGVPLLDRGDERESLNQIDLSQVQKIEMIEGPMSTIYGTDALAGVINIITKQSDENTWNINAGIAEETAGEEYKPFGSKGLHTQQLGGSWNNGNWNVMANVMHYDFTGYGADSTERNHTWKPKEQWMPSVRIGYRKNHLNIYYRNDYLYETISSKGKINWDNYKSNTQIFTTRKMSHQLQANYKKDKWALDAILAYTDYSRKTETFITDYQAKTQTLTSGPGEQDLSKINAFHFRPTMFYEFSQKLQLQAGMEVTREDAAGARIDGNPSVSNYAVFLSAEYKPFTKLKIKPGARITKNSLYDAPPLIPSLNIWYNVKDNIILRAAYAQGYRAPALRELYFDFQDANHNLKGNPDLKAEHSQTFNVSFTYYRDLREGFHFSSELGYFYNQFKDLISFAVNPNNSLEYSTVNIDQYKTSGLSLNNKLQYNNFEFKLGGILLGQYNNLSEAENLNQKVHPFSWSPEINAEVQYTLPKSNTSLNLFYKYTGRRLGYATIPDSNNNLIVSQTAIAPFQFADATIMQPLFKRWVVTLGVRNIFNITDIQNSGTDNGSAHGSSGFIPVNYGRSYFLKLNFQFNRNTKNNKNEESNIGSDAAGCTRSM